MTGLIRQWPLYLLMASASLTLLACSSGSDEEAEYFSWGPAIETNGQEGMVSTPNPLATDIGLAVLQNGGNAVDAAVAVTLVLGLVEAPETGLGGGGFLMHYSASDQQTRFYDGRETAPMAAEADRFTLFGQPVPLYGAVPSGIAVGVPGLLDMLGRVHREHGQLPWSELVTPAADLAERGVPMSRHLQEQIDADKSLLLFGDMRRYFRAQADDDPPQLVNPELAETLRRIASQGPRALYQPPLSTAIIERAADAPVWSSDLVQADFDQYQSKSREPVCGQYRQWRICGAGPPSSGGIAVVQILGMLSEFDMPGYQPDDAEAWHLVMEATRLAFADRHRYLGDPDVVTVPVEGLIDPGYLARRAALIEPGQSLPSPTWGTPQGADATRAEWQGSPVRSGTSHTSIVDADGNAVSITSSIEKPFGTRMMTAGFILNNQLTDFTFDPEADFGPHPNAPGPGKRPRSSMSPVLVFDADDQLVLVLGSRGGSRIISYVVKALVGVLDWDLSIQEAINLPNVVFAGDVVELEEGTVAESWQPSLERWGQGVELHSLTSGLHGTQRRTDGWHRGADPRLGGDARGYRTPEAP